MFLFWGKMMATIRFFLRQWERVSRGKKVTGRTSHCYWRPAHTRIFRTARQVMALSVDILSNPFHSAWHLLTTNNNKKKKTLYSLVKKYSKLVGKNNKTSYRASAHSHLLVSVSFQSVIICLALAKQTTFHSLSLSENNNKKNIENEES